MRKDIAKFVIQFLQERGEQSTASVLDALARSGLPNSDHRYSTLRNYYLAPLAAEGAIRLVREAPGEGGGVWAL